MLSCGAKKPEPIEKINGICLVAPPYQLKYKYFQPIQKTGANWVAIIPYAFCSPSQPEVSFDHPKQWYGETSLGIRQTITLARKAGLKIMLKPHLWVIGQGWAGDLSYPNQDQLDIWMASYTRYVLHFAQIAQELNVEMISIGTEIRQIAKTNEIYWTELIRNIRKIYQGHLTYSANWDNYENISFWDELDYIGIDAYFPISDSKSPSKSELVEKGSITKQKIESFSKIHLKKVLFTEFGFESKDYCTSGHWIKNRETKFPSQDCQANAYSSIFNLYWDEDWFVGGFAWKWHFNHEEVGGATNTDFTPQNKLAEKILKNQYSNFKNQ